jgi:glycosyltransferase involved in cell wall biosynthesis
VAKKRLILGVTIGGSSRLMDGQAAYFKSLGYEVYLISQDHYKEKLFCEREGITHLPVTIDNEISPLKDLLTLFQITKHFKTIKPDIVNLGTPKMGLLGMIAAKFLGIKKRIYTCRGLRFETETGLKRRILVAMEKWTVSMAHQVIYVSPSLLKAANRSGVAQINKSIVIEFGSSNGVNTLDFDFSKIDKQQKTALVDKYQLANVITIGFVGRITQHKGCYELVEAFENIYQNHPNVRLIMMGHIKCDIVFESRFRKHPGIIHIPFQDDVPLYMSLFDIFVLPSWREGFPNVPIQAAAMNIPIVVSDATGCVDSVNNNINGMVFPVKNTKELEITLLKYIEDENLRNIHGLAGEDWANKFTNKIIWDGINNIYKL